MGQKLPLEFDKLVESWRKQFSISHPITTTNTYQSFIKKFILFTEMDITSQKVREFRSYESTKGKFVYANSSCKGALKSFFTFLVEQRGFNPEILTFKLGENLKNQTDRHKVQLKSEEINMIVEKMGTKSLAVKLFTITLATLGLRIREAITLTWDDFNWGDWLQNQDDFGEVTIRNTKRGKKRTIPVKPFLMKTLYYYSPAKKEDSHIPYRQKINLVFVFNDRTPVDYLEGGTRTEQITERVQYNYINYVKNYYRFIMNEVVDELKKENKLDSMRKVTPHFFRHASAQYWCDKGMSLDSLKQYLGHSSFASTEVYLQQSPTKLKNEMKMLTKSSV